MKSISIAALLLSVSLWPSLAQALAPAPSAQAEPRSDLSNPRQEQSEFLAAKKSGDHTKMMAEKRDEVAAYAQYKRTHPRAKPADGKRDLSDPRKEQSEFLAAKKSGDHAKMVAEKRDETAAYDQYRRTHPRHHRRTAHPANPH